MKYRSQIKLPIQEYRKVNLNDEFFFRDVARKMVNEIPIEDLIKLFSIKKIDPFSEESKDIIINGRFSDREEIKILREDQAVLIKAEISF